ncbi:hypothetical protein [Novosphingopyxis sp. YJ-S2-01]|uniref:hypothetical protein n=1 Tax=Novosphingopyxis sp. YJ-S2-01 TaxID=2794021 RepID=UPI0018DB404C|nr:hypothetical protein [Novosphingopyxis sp. YJ-S2-01]MBH9537486.1 hypothetical protein [Novosphingopyxis sp. YJ-S2-01]
MTQETKFTPGPWEVGGGKGGGISSYVYCDNDLGTAVAATTFPNDMTGWPEATRIANAHLIAAAPDGYEVAEMFLDFARSGKSFIYPPGGLQMLERFIAKARGEQS